MNRKELIKTFMMISNCNKPFGLKDFIEKFSALRVKSHVALLSKPRNASWVWHSPDVATQREINEI